ncbi:hypothetical protein QNI19_32275 [Cytophagaceae bacterium DM2B3-1]|uniref:Peptidase C51 domain-containing protein n=1 Tax=Xanthocytophaga flava TaxID=3048013 RepID=A0ABT7CVX8_9BACT|nr:hypothetical protein [Xanthocytophaga flavus]MDJ1497661.1 hypothetical protein [Xanthocytophaga flavus]
MTTYSARYFVCILTCCFFLAACLLPVPWIVCIAASDVFGRNHSFITNSGANTEKIIQGISANDITVEGLPEDSLSQANQQIIELIEKNGKRLAPTYKQANCTEFMTRFLSLIYTLTPKQKQQINIVTDQPLDSICAHIARFDYRPEYKGVCHFITDNKLGQAVWDLQDVQAGDLIQFWWLGGQTGHCGVIKEINLDKGYFTMYGSTPKEGFGVSTYPILADLYFFIARITKLPDSCK